MTYYLVENHLGKELYVSQRDQDSITRVCPECGDCDWIVGSWEDDEDYEEGLIDTFIDYIIWDKLNLEQDPLSFLQKLNYYSSLYDMNKRNIVLTDDIIGKALEEYIEMTKLEMESSYKNWINLAKDIIPENIFDTFQYRFDNAIADEFQQMKNNIGKWGIFPFNRKKFSDSLLKEGNGIIYYYGNLDDISLSWIISSLITENGSEKDIFLYPPFEAPVIEAMDKYRPGIKEAYYSAIREKSL